MLRVTYEELHDVLRRALLGLGFEPERAALCARLFADTDRDGVYSHGLNRFPRFVQMIRRGIVDVRARPALAAAHGALERWDGRRGPGNLNAHSAMERAVGLARAHGLGCVALADTNHWMRGGSYGWQAAEAGAAAVCWTNTMPNLPPWGATDARLGNNPLVVAVPRARGEHVVLDMAMSQFSYGALESYRARGEQLPVPGGYDGRGRLTRDPAAIEHSGRPLPIGFWKAPASRSCSTCSPRSSPAVAPRTRSPPTPTKSTASRKSSSPSTPTRAPAPASPTTSSGTFKRPPPAARPSATPASARSKPADATWPKASPSIRASGNK